MYMIPKEYAPSMNRNQRRHSADHVARQVKQDIEQEKKEEKQFDWDSMLMELPERWKDNERLRKYVACWNWYVLDCKKDKEETHVTFHRYMEMVPMKQVEEMIAGYHIEW